MTHTEHILYKCGICGWLHPWEWDGDCREDAYRVPDTGSYAAIFQVPIQDILVRSHVLSEVEGMEERVEEDRQRGNDEGREGVS
jgi:hypothetical protein